MINTGVLQLLMLMFFYRVEESSNGEMPNSHQEGERIEALNI